MRVLVIVLSCILMAACAQAPEKIEPTTAQLAERDAAGMAAINCGKQYVYGLDDGVSDASTVAFALSLRCGKEYNAFTETFGATMLDNERQRQMFRERRSSRESRIEFFLPIVMSYRNGSTGK